MLTSEQLGWTLPFGDWLRAERERAGLTRKQVAARMRVGVNTVERWEQGARRPIVDAFVRWCQVVGVPIELGIRTLAQFIGRVTVREQATA